MTPRHQKPFIPARLALEALESRLTPALTTSFLGGLLSVTSDAASDQAALTVSITGGILLNGSAITGAPTIGNTTAILMRGNGGDDMLDASGVPGGTMIVMLDGGDGNDTLTGGPGNDTLTGGNGDDSLFGSEGDDMLAGNDGRDSLSGGAGDDQLLGGAGNDDLTGGTGNDTFDGGGDAGDALFEPNVAGNVSLNDSGMIGLGTDVFLNPFAGVFLSGDASANVFDCSAFTRGVRLNGNGGSDTLIGGIGNDQLDGGDGNDTLTGGDGDDNLNGRNGTDILSGGLGTDSLQVSAGNDALTGGGGSDTISASADSDFTLTDTSLKSNLGLATLRGIEKAFINGGNGVNVINTSGFTRGSVRLSGGAGADVLIGGAGDDFLDGGPGNDTLIGGPGIDLVFAGGDGDFTLTNTRLVGQGTDTLSSIDRATLSGAPGDNVINVAAFTRGGVHLSGGGGNDTLTGTSHNDTFGVGTGGDTIVNGGGGIDLVNMGGDANWTLTNTSLTSNVSALGSATLHSIEQASIFGGAGNNTLDASTFTLGSVSLNGGSGNDILKGGSGDDTLFGGDGNDSLIGGAGTDTVSEFRFAAFTFTLSDNSLAIDAETDSLAGIERAILKAGPGSNSFRVDGWTGQASLDGGGGPDQMVTTNDLNFTLTNTLLTRSDGARFTLLSIENAQLIGGGGDNTFTVSGWTGRADLDGGGGNDAIFSTNNANFALSDAELIRSDGATFFLTGIKRAILVGGAGNNIIDASAFSGVAALLGGLGNDYLIGGTNSDRLDGGTGFDILFGGPGSDILLNGEANTP